MLGLWLSMCYVEIHPQQLMALQVINPWSNIIVFEEFAGNTCTRSSWLHFWGL
jgi:hypothetical protein